MEEVHARGGEGVAEGHGGGAGEVAFEHDGVADVGDVGAGGDGDGLFDEALLYADAHVTEHELEEVFGFEGGGALEEGFEESGAVGGEARCGEGDEGLGDVVQGEGWLGVGGGEEIEGGCAEVAVPAVGGGEGGIGAVGDVLKGAGEDGAAGVELAGVGLGEGLAGEVEAEEAGDVGGLGGDFGECGGDGGALLEAAAFSGEFFGERCELGEGGHGGGWVRAGRVLLYDAARMSGGVRGAARDV